MNETTQPEKMPLTFMEIEEAKWNEASHPYAEAAREVEKQRLDQRVSHAELFAIHSEIN